MRFFKHTSIHGPCELQTDLLWPCMNFEMFHMTFHVHSTNTYRYWRKFEYP